MNKIKDIELTEEVEKMLDGKINPLRNYCITLGQSSGSKGVLFVLYSYLKECKSAYVNPCNYLGNLGADINTAVINARKRIPKFQLIIEDWEAMQTRRESCSMPFGKYAGMTIEDIFDIDEKYIFWLSGSKSLYYIKSKKAVAMIAQYAEIAKENIITKNEANSLPALPIDTEKTKRTLKLYSMVHLAVDNYGQMVEKYKFIDEFGNKYFYSGSTKKLVGIKVDDTVSVSCKIVGSFSSLGVLFNKISFR